MFTVWIAALQSPPYPPHVLHTKVHPCLSWGKFHQSLVYYGSDHEASTPTTYILDFVPDITLTPPIMVGLFLGQRVPGKLRLLRFEGWKSNRELEEQFQDKIDAEEYQRDNACIGASLRSQGVNASLITSWNMNYHLYKHNCWHFCDALSQSEQSKSV